MLKVIKLSAVAVALLFVAAQFIRPERVNPPTVSALTLDESTNVPARVAEVLDRSCMDCHSNRTEWPWYSNVAPVSWLVIDHVNHGRRHLNFSEWATYDRERAGHHLKDVCGEAKRGTMPLGSYLLAHRDAALSPEDVEVLCDWAADESARLADRRR